MHQWTPNQRQSSESQDTVPKYLNAKNDITTHNARHITKTTPSVHNSTYNTITNIGKKNYSKKAYRLTQTNTIKMKYMYFNRF